MIRVHKRCGEIVSYANMSTGYSAVCPSCDEDLFLMEMALLHVEHLRCSGCKNIGNATYNFHTQNYRCADCSSFVSA